MTEVEHSAFNSLVNTVAQLRSPDGGCPWDQVQTHSSIGDYLIEEAYETLDAIQANDPIHLCEELGDVLLQVVLHSQIATDEGEFTIDEVCAGINEKMIRRHPHVFGEAHVENAHEVVNIWDQIKLAEKAATANSTKHLLDDVPTHFPSLLHAQKISRKAVAVGFEWESLDEVWQKVAEERAELEAAYAAAPKTSDGKVLRDESDALSDVEIEFGDLLFSLVNVARKMGINAEGALRASNAKFRKRFARVEEEAWNEGRTLEDLSLAEMENYWKCAKKEEKMALLSRKVLRKEVI